MCRICRSRRNPRRCRPRRAPRPRSPAATSRSTPTARTASLARIRARTRRTTSPRRAYACRSWRPGTWPARRSTRAALCWSCRTPGFPCRCPKARYPSRCGRSCIWRCSTRIVTDPDYPVSANYSYCVTRAGSRCRRGVSFTIAQLRRTALRGGVVQAFAPPRCYFYINARTCLGLHLVYMCDVRYIGHPLYRFHCVWGNSERIELFRRGRDEISRNL